MTCKPAGRVRRKILPFHTCSRAWIRAVSFSTKSAISRARDIPQLRERRTGQSFQSVSVRSKDCWPVLGGVEMFSFLLNLVRVYVKCDVPFWCDVYFGSRGSKCGETALTEGQWLFHKKSDHMNVYHMSPRLVAWATGVMVGILGCVWNVLPNTLGGGCDYKKAYHYLFKKL